MAHKKTFQHEMEEVSEQIFRGLMPSFWSVRKYGPPDYGIDLVVEVFDRVSKTEAVTSGEHFFVQLKSQKECVKTTHYVDLEKSLSIDVVKYSLETKTLATASKMGSAIPLLLFLVCLREEKVYYLCLNDYISATGIVVPQGQKRKTVYIPIKNCLKSEEVALRLRLYSARAKLFSLFSLMDYQREQIEYMADGDEGLRYVDREMAKIKNYFSEIESLDIWRIEHPWGGISLMYKEYIVPTRKYFETGEFVGFDSLGGEWLFEKVGELQFFKLVWRQLCLFHRIYHELIRQYELPSEMEILYNT